VPVSPQTENHLKFTNRPQRAHSQQWKDEAAVKNQKHTQVFQTGPRELSVGEMARILPDAQEKIAHLQTGPREHSVVIVRGASLIMNLRGNVGSLFYLFIFELLFFTCFIVF